MALKIAADLLHVPSRVQFIRSEPLPEDVLALLRVAAGDEESTLTAAATLDRPPAMLRKAALFFIEQILFAPDADSYRVLGTNSRAPSSELRRHLALLLQLLHPDLDPRGERSVFIGRVTTAWNNLKTPERRAAYDDLLRSLKSKKARTRQSRLRPAYAPKGNRYTGGAHLRRYPSYLPSSNKSGLLRRVLSMLFYRALP